MIQPIAAAMSSLNNVASGRNTGSPGDFVLENFFSGKTVAHAKFAAVNGVVRKFRIDITGTWEDDCLKLHEKFEFDDGELDTKNWTFRKIADGKYVANREDMLKPVEATLRNGTLRYTYKIFLESDNQANVVRFRDRITMVDNKTLKNTAMIFKVGIPVGLVTGTFLKQD